MISVSTGQKTFFLTYFLPWTSYLYVRYFLEPSWYSEFDGGFEKYFWWRGWNLVAENEKKSFGLLKDGKSDGGGLTSKAEPI